MFRLPVFQPLLARMTALACTVLLGVAAEPAGAQDRPAGAPSEDSVRAVEMARGRALMAADTVALSRMVAAEFIEISRRGLVRVRAENMREIATGELKLTKVSYDSLTVRLYGDMALLTGIADNVGTYRGFEFAGKIRYLRIFARRDGRWQAVAMQQTPIQ